MQLSTRNQLKGKITGVQLGGIMAEVTVDVGGQTVVATQSHAEVRSNSTSPPATT